RQYGDRYYFWPRPVQLGYSHFEKDQDPGRSYDPVPHRILQRLQPYAVQQSELRCWSHICHSQREGWELRTNHIHQREPARDPVRVEIQLLATHGFRQTRPTGRPSLYPGCAGSAGYLLQRPTMVAKPVSTACTRPPEDDHSPA